LNIRYLGFEQRKNARAYLFDAVEKGCPARHFVVTADLALFLTHHVPLQEGPALSAVKLNADLAVDVQGEDHELTDSDLRSHNETRLLAEATRAQKRGPRRPPNAGATPKSPWRNFGI
jgi:hypothetical protein